MTSCEKCPKIEEKILELGAAYFKSVESESWKDPASLKESLWLGSDNLASCLNFLESCRLLEVKVKTEMKKTSKEGLILSVKAPRKCKIYYISSQLLTRTNHCFILALNC
jgi:hypothetical protein